MVRKSLFRNVSHDKIVLDLTLLMSGYRKVIIMGLTPTVHIISYLVKKDLALLITSKYDYNNKNKHRVAIYNSLKN